MKRQFLFFLFILSILSIQNIFYSQINQQWKWVHPMPQGNTLNWVKAFSSTEWIAIGNNGTFMRTTNSGTSWDVYTNAGGISAITKQGKHLKSGWFFNSSTGLICGASRWIARTTNGGINWDSIGVPVGNDYTSLEDMYFINNSTGFICGIEILLKTTNAGLSWTVIPGVTYVVKSMFALDESNIFCGINGYVMKTTNGGANWILHSTGISSAYDILFLNSNTGFLCGDVRKVLFTTNGGINWVSKQTKASSLSKIYTDNLSYGVTFSQNFNGTTFPPSGWRAVNVLGSNFVWVRSTSQYYSSPASALILNDCNFSTGGGLDWLISPQIHINSGDTLSFWLKPIITGFTDSLCVRVSTTDTALSSFNTRVLYIADGAGYPSTSTWTNYRVSLNALAGQNVYIGFKHQDMCGDGIFLDDVFITSPSVQSTRLFAVGDPDSIYITTNMGDNWATTSVLEPSQYYSDWYSIDTIGSTMVMCGDNGIFNVSTNNGVTWTAKNYRITSTSYYDVWCNYGTGKVWAVGMAGNPAIHDQILYSSNGGINFQIQNINGSTNFFFSICMLNENTGYICGGSGTIIKTINGGISWETLVTSISASNSLCKIDFIDMNTGWVFSNTNNAGGPIWHTTNSGLNWTEQTLTDTSAYGRSIYTADMINNSLGYCINSLASVHITTNGGINWTARTPRIFNGLFNELYMVSDNSGYVCGSSSKLFKTTNGWLNYDSVSVPITGTTFSSTKWLDMDKGFIATGNGNILKTTNGGVVWEIMQTSTSYLMRIFAKAIDTAYAVGSSGNILKLGRGPVGTTTTWKNTIPSNYYLGQNYPNPFNPVTEFKFGLYNKAKVSLKVYDITGRLVHTFFDNMQLNAGTVTVKYDGSNLASGVYFYTLFIDDNRVDTKKMILIK